LLNNRRIRIGSGSIPLTSGSGSLRPKNMWTGSETLLGAYPLSYPKGTGGDESAQVGAAAPEALAAQQQAATRFHCRRLRVHRYTNQSISPVIQISINHSNDQQVICQAIN
jgi:hypothetical protein